MATARSKALKKDKEWNPRPKFTPSKEQELAIEKDREEINKSSTKRALKGFEKWRLSGARTH